MAMSGNSSPAESGTPRWFLVANASRARAYVRRIGAPGYEVVREWDSPEARMSSAELGEDRPGRLFPAAGAMQRSGIEPETREASPKGQAQLALLATLVEDLTQALRRRELAGLYLLAPAPLLPRLRDSMPTDLRRVLVGEEAGDITRHPSAEIFARLDAFRHAPGGAPST